MIWVRTRTPSGTASLRRREAAGAALEPLRAGRHRPYMKNVQAFTQVRHRSARSTARAGRCAPEGAVAANTAPDRTSFSAPTTMPSLSREAGDVTDLCNYLGKKYGGWYPTCELYLKPTASAGSACRRRDRQHDGLPREPGESSGFPELSEGHRQLPQDDEGAEGEGHARRLRARPRPGDANTWCHWLCGPSAASWSTRRTTWPSTARRRCGRSSTRKSSTHVHPWHAVVARPNNNKPSSTGRSRDQQRHLDLLRAKNSRTRRSTRCRPTSTTRAIRGPAGVSSACHLFMNR